MHLLRWILFRRIRKGGELLGIVRRHYNHQRDILPEKNRMELESGMREFESRLKDPSTSKTALATASTTLEDLAHRWLKAYAHAGYRDNFESFLGTAVLVFAFKTFFATPMEIPTGSAQPTFYGITAEDLRDRPEVPIPTGFARLWERWIKGTSYYEVIAAEDGELRGITNVRKEFGSGTRGIGKKCDVVVGNRTYTVHWAPEIPEDHLRLYDRYNDNAPFKASFKQGEPIIRCRVRAGDRLFVERFTYNFRKPRRGEYFVFKSTGVAPSIVTQGTHYIKRLIAFGGETVRIGDDRHVYINGRPLGTNDPGFERIYAFDPNSVPTDSVYSGYVNGTVYQKAFAHFLATTPRGGVSPAVQKSWATARASYYAGVTRYFPDQNTEFVVRTNCFLGFGDNTMSSSDGRHWGDVPREKVIGKSWMVMWPFTDRWGW